MEVTLIASTTVLNERALPEGEGPRITEQWMPDLNDDRGVWQYVDDPDLLAEFAGRACYQSWDRPNPKTATNAGYMANIIKQAHFSVLEHASATFYVTGVSRSLTHELVRHRHLSFSQLSQRYVDGREAEMVYPPALTEGDAWELDLAMGNIRAAYIKIVELLEGRGLNKKESRQAARAILPNMTETKIVVTGNMRAWRDMLSKRYHVAADAEIREFAKIVLGHLRSIAPNTFADIPEEPYGSK